MILTKHEETKKGRCFHENEKLRIFVSSCSIIGGFPGLDIFKEAVEKVLK